MDDHSLQYTREHNTVVGIITVACIGTIVGGISLGWEFWVPPLIVVGLIVTWFLHITQYGSKTFRENFYLVFTMLISFYHGVHPTSMFEIVVVSALLMVNVTLFRRKEFVTLMLAEFFVLMILQVVMAVRSGSMIFDTLNVARLVVHVVAEFCIYKGLSDAIRNNRQDREELEMHYRDRERSRVDMEDFLVNISHELRTPVNVINGMSALILKKEEREDVAAIRDAGLRLSRQIEDIQDYSEIQRGDVVLEEDKYMITSVLSDIISDYMGREENSELDLIVDLDPTLPVMLNGDSRKIGKVIRHLLDNATKFTKLGGIYLRVSGIRREYGINLTIEVTDTGVGMSRAQTENISRGVYRLNGKRDRSTGGIGLGFSIVYGFVRKMNGFVNLESRNGKGTTFRVSIAQEIIDPAPCLSVQNERFINAVYYVFPEKYSVPRVGAFYRHMATNLAAGLRLNVYFASNLRELGQLLERGDITHVFMGDEEYADSPDYFEELAKLKVTVAVSASKDFRMKPESRVICLPKPLYAIPVVHVLNGETSTLLSPGGEEERRPVLDGVRALVVDDEPMNLVVAVGLFKEYHMIIDTAASGKEAIEKYEQNDYTLIFMDHMMPEMDGVEAMRRIREIALKKGQSPRIIALTANAISGAREMFLREGFDGFISKPISIQDFERTIHRVLPAVSSGQKERDL
ncbi:MAG: response regulator [Lachnospiraceae bacterium]|nr:response regulator [Lachnospiraceae bacterium]